MKVHQIEKINYGKRNGQEVIENQFRDFILTNDHPCIMAQTVFSMEHVDLKIYDSLGLKKGSKKLYDDLKSYIDQYDFSSNQFQTFIAVFPNSGDMDEIEFEKRLWKQLQNLHGIDDVAWDKNVSDNPDSSDFSFSIAGKAFYIVGLHPNSSRIARRSPYPALAFNLHWQFEKLREMGAYHNVRDKIRERDQQVQGSINPTLEDFGDSSEARQYSGRKVSSQWKCPFSHK